ncbi:MAG: PilZ domain-containing protein [Nitrospiraceae bacterium]|nr:MAG: PilZ domain-containing protein [Nitrospiraceae bacterium]
MESKMSDTAGYRFDPYPMEKQGALNQKRAFERILANVDIRIFYNAMFYRGLMVNLSEKGMFIRTSQSFPSEAVLPVVINSGEEILTVLARVKWIKKTGDYQDGIGVEIMSPSKGFMEFISSIKAVT